MGCRHGAARGWYRIAGNNRRRNDCQCKFRINFLPFDRLRKLSLDDADHANDHRDTRVGCGWVVLVSRERDFRVHLGKRVNRLMDKPNFACNPHYFLG